MSSTANHALGEQIKLEAEEAVAVLFRTKMLAAKLAPHLVGQLKRFILDEATLVEFKRELNQFDLRTQRWRP